MLPWGLESFGSDLAGMAAKRMRSSHPSVYRPPADNYPLNKANQLIADIYKHYPSPKDYIREDILTVLNQVRPSSLSYQKSFSARALPGIRAEDIVAGEFAANASPPVILTEGGGAGPELV